MRLSNVEDVGGVGLKFIVSDKFERYEVLYGRLIENALCSYCTRVNCEHVQFVKRVLVENEAWQSCDFIEDCCDVKISFSELSKMREAFTRAVNICPKPKPENKKPKEQISPFSMIEVDDVD